MDTRKAAAEYRMASWMELMRERSDTGETIKGFCERRGISRQSFFYWQRKLREIAVKQVVKETSEQSKSLVPNGWAQVSTAKDEPSAEGEVESTLLIEIGSYRMLVSESTDAALLEKVCRVLAATC